MTLKPSDKDAKSFSSFIDERRGIRPLPHALKKVAADLAVC